MKQNRVNAALVLSAIGICLIFHASCTDKKSGTSDEDSLKRDTLKYEASAIRGSWTVNRYYLADMSALDEKTASEWLNKKLIIDTALHFDFSEIRSYVEYNKNEIHCAFPAIDSPQVEPALEYFDASRGIITDLSLENSKIKVYHTSCQDHPFSEFIMTDKYELVISWDGAFFVLTKVKES